jgi:hypothetical protein
MRNLLSVAIALLVSFSSFSQKNNKYFSVVTGASLPIGDFGNDDITDEKAGVAKLGQAGSISYVQLTGKEFGFAITIQGQRNPLDTKAAERKFSELNFNQGLFFVGTAPNQPPPSSPPVRYPNWKFQKRSWLSGALLMGGYGEFVSTGSQGFSIITKLLVGPVYAESPEISGTSITDTATAKYEQTSSSSFGLAYLLSGGIKLHINKRLYFLTSLEYMGTNRMKYDDIEATLTTTKGSPGPGFVISQYKVTGSSKQTISTINLVAGIAITL